MSHTNLIRAHRALSFDTSEVDMVASLLGMRAVDELRYALTGQDQRGKATIEDLVDRITFVDREVPGLFGRVDVPLAGR